MQASTQLKNSSPSPGDGSRTSVGIRDIAFGLGP